MLTADQSLFRPAARFSFAHLQLPLWLFQNDCASLSMNARVVYAFLLSRFRLSQTNNQAQPGSWVNEEGALYIVYPRAQIAEDMHISLNSACACMKELAAANLIAEDRKGQGKANRIYLVDSPLLHSVSCEKSGSDENPAEAAQTEAETPLNPAEQAFSAAENTPESQDSVFFTSAARDSEMQDSVTPESQKTEPNYIYLNNNKKIYNNLNSSVTVPLSSSKSLSPVTEETRIAKKSEEKQQLPELREICEHSGLELLQNPAYGYTAQNHKLMREAIHYLYFLDSLSLQDAHYSWEYVHQRMHEITIETLDMTLERIRHRPQKIRKIVAYAAKTLFSCILERGAESALDFGISEEDEASAPLDELQYAMLSEMGEYRKPTVSEARFLAYAEENRLSPDIVRALVQATIARSGSFRVEDAPGILREWDEQGFFSGNEDFTKESACSDWEREWVENVRAYEQQRNAGA